MTLARLSLYSALYIDGSILALLVDIDKPLNHHYFSIGVQLCCELMRLGDS